MSYPIPSYAASIWLAGDRIMLAFGETKDSQGYSTALPRTEKGLAVALQILSEREKLSSGTIKTATKAQPTQFNIEREMLRFQAKETLTLEDL